MNIAELPDDIILIMFRFLKITDIVNLKLVCSRFNFLIDSEQLWKKLCLRDYAVSPGKIWYAWNSKDFYTKDGIIAYDCLPPLDDSFREVIHENEIVFLSPNECEGEHFHKFRFRRIFSLKPVGKQIMCFCFQSMVGFLDRIGHSPCPDTSSDGHSCSETCHNDKMFVCKTEEGCKFVCHQPDRHDYTIDYWFEIEHGFRPADASLTQNIIEKLCTELHYYVRLKKFDTLSKLCCYYDMMPITIEKSNCLSSFVDKFLPRPGLYFGTYSAHGWEIIDLHFNDNDQFLEGIKITGDPNVPAGQITFRVHLKKRLFFDETDQNTLSDINSAISRNESKNFEEIKSRENVKQTYTTPDGFFERGTKKLPTFCLSRYVAEGQIAGNRFRNPSFTPCVFTTFDEKFFGILWLELQSVSMYYRANNLDVVDFAR